MISNIQIYIQNEKNVQLLTRYIPTWLFFSGKYPHTDQKRTYKQKSKDEPSTKHNSNN